MKYRHFFVALIVAFMITAGALQPSASARAAEYNNIAELYQYWDFNGMPEYIAGVSSTDGDPEHLTVTLVQGYEEQEAEIRGMLADDSTLTIVTGAAYSDEYLKRVREEIEEQYMINPEDGVSKLVGIGIGWRMVGEEVKGFGESETESRVVVTVYPEYYDELKSVFESKYSDAVYLEISEGINMYTAEMSEQTDFSEVETSDSEENSTEVTRTGAIVFLLVCAAGLLTVVAIKKKKAEKEKSE